MLHHMLRLGLSPLFFMEADTGGGTAAPAAPAPVAPPAPDPAHRALESLLNRNDNDATKVSLQLLDDNKDLREKNRQLKADLSAAEGKAPAAGALVLMGDDAKAYEAFKTLNLKPEQVQTIVGEHGQFQKERTLANVAKAANVDLETLKLVGANLDYEIKTATDAEGKPVQLVMVKQADKEVPLADYAQANWASVLPVLTMTQPAAATGAPVVPAPAKPGVPWIPQPVGGGGAAAPDLATQYLQKKQADDALRPNPLQAQVMGLQPSNAIGSVGPASGPAVRPAAPANA